MPYHDPGPEPAPPTQVHPPESHPHSIECEEFDADTEDDLAAESPTGRPCRAVPMFQQRYRRTRRRSSATLSRDGNQAFLTNLDSSPSSTGMQHPVTACLPLHSAEKTPISPPTFALSQRRGSQVLGVRVRPVTSHRISTTRGSHPSEQSVGSAVTKYKQPAPTAVPRSSYIEPTRQSAWALLNVDCDPTSGLRTGLLPIQINVPGQGLTTRTIPVTVRTTALELIHAVLSKVP